MTPDGPTGPIYKFKAGAVIASMRSGSPLYLCSAKIGRAKIFASSWDNFSLPLPFSKIILYFSDPIEVDKDKSKEEIGLLINKCETELNKMQKNN
jgi:lysophospholipid acyltransferase (LPLAT)-like uncharacterized protein